MSKINESDFRATFATMASQAIIDRAELALLLSTSAGAISQMAYRGELPIRAFPHTRRACWFVEDIRRWLDQMALNRSPIFGQQQSQETIRPSRRIGRPRLPTSSVV
jgi:hypothetical protein